MQPESSHTNPLVLVREVTNCGAVPDLPEDLHNFHFVGISGIGMSGIAKVLLKLGYQVSGSDLKGSPITENLASLGAKIHIGHDQANVNGADLVVCSSAVPHDNIELQRARAKNTRIVHRSEMLAALMRRQRGIAIAGTHGKSTTTSMIALVLERSGFDPTVVVGGELNDIGGNAKLGRGEFFVAEADESDGSLLNLAPERAVITNVEIDHLDFYKTEDRLIETFREFASRLPGHGLLVACAECPNVQRVLTPGLAAPLLTYGLGPEADYRAENIEHKNGGLSFHVVKKGRSLGVFSLSIPGKHNVLNALATLIMTEAVGVELESIAEALPQYKGIKRRWQTIGMVDNIWVVDDYAHHPSEVKATLAAARASTDRRIIAVFQPHRYSRTQYLCEEFGGAFGDADHVIITDVYPAMEKPIQGVSGEMVADAIR
ncbi:MAG: UDP-N-acetylmuramate--L-alanine ligase, partial [Armatimonadetes bacterium]|nr:UDP-N-acetylmuramate--L-alanine ligase [Armatimonadota bacterium]